MMRISVSRSLQSVFDLLKRLLEKRNSLGSGNQTFRERPIAEPFEPSRQFVPALLVVVLQRFRFAGAPPSRIRLERVGERRLVGQDHSHKDKETWEAEISTSFLMTEVGQSVAQGASEPARCTARSRRRSTPHAKSPETRAANCSFTAKTAESESVTLTATTPLRLQAEFRHLVTSSRPARAMRCRNPPGRGRSRRSRRPPACG